MLDVELGGDDPLGHTSYRGHLSTLGVGLRPHSQWECGPPAHTPSALPLGVWASGPTPSGSVGLRPLSQWTVETVETVDQCDQRLFTRLRPTFAVSEFTALFRSSTFFMRNNLLNLWCDSRGRDRCDSRGRNDRGAGAGACAAPELLLVALDNLLDSRAEEDVLPVVV